MKVLITGGSGFIGTNLVDRYRQRGDTVLNLDMNQPRNPDHRDNWQQVDVRDYERLALAILNFSPEIVFHFAARTDLDGHSDEDYAANTAGLRNVIDALVLVPHLRRVIFASSRLVCRIGYRPKTEDDYNPTTAYGKSKAIGETIVRHSDKIHATWTIVRPTSIWGPWFDVPYRTFFLAVARGRYMHPRGTEIRKSFGYVGNTVFQLERLSEADSALVDRRTLYLADYTPIEVGDMAKKIRQAVGGGTVRGVDRHVLKLMAHVGDALRLLGWLNPPLTTFRLDNLLTPMVYDLAPLEKIVGNVPYSVDEGIHETVTWLRKRGLIA
jgi:GlcNAc-P-P-Und epimerase